MKFVPAVSDGGSPDESMEELIPGYLVTSYGPIIRMHQFTALRSDDAAAFREDC